jgi:hypothetical protein
MSYVWVFHGEGGRFTSGVFKNLATAEEWIKINKLTGILSKYPVDIGVYDWAIQSNFFEVKKDSEANPQFIQKFTSASQDHYHFEAGKIDNHD